MTTEVDFKERVLQNLAEDIEHKEQTLSEFKQKFIEHPIYTLEWYFFPIVELQFLITELKHLHRFMTKETMEETIQNIKKERMRLLNQVLDMKRGNRSTSSPTNLSEDAKDNARKTLIKQLDDLIADYEKVTGNNLNKIIYQKSI